MNALQPGIRLGPYQVIGPIGAGGMGEVFRAVDVGLQREVAIKTLPLALRDDPERLARFQREATLLAALNHPNIATVYGIESGALVMELVPGATLSERLSTGPVPVDEALAVARQIIEALEYAHDHNIIHRDLKPANIKITPDGVTKVLDFGLAKAIDEGPVPASDPANSPTITVASTRAGVIMGTAAYMSPEQVTGKSLDRRTDIFSFGCVLFEMLTGTPAFNGDTVAETLAAIVKDTPDWSRLPATTPQHVRGLLERCLAKDRKRRLQAIAEARILLDDGASLPLSPRVPVARGWNRTRCLAVVGLAAVECRLAGGNSRDGERTDASSSSSIPPGC